MKTITESLKKINFNELREDIYKINRYIDYSVLKLEKEKIIESINRDGKFEAAFSELLPIHFPLSPCYGIPAIRSRLIEKGYNVKVIGNSLVVTIEGKK